MTDTETSAAAVIAAAPRSRIPKKGGPSRPGVNVMNDDIYRDLMRYEEMVGLCSGSNPDDPEQGKRDLAQYGKEYGAPADAEGYPQYSPAKIVRFLVEACGHSYNDALAAVVEDMQGWPSAPRDDLPEPKDEARAMRAANRNIIEDLFDLKVIRLSRDGDREGVGYAWDVTREVMAIEGFRLKRRNDSRSVDEPDRSHER